MEIDELIGEKSIDNSLISTDINQALNNAELMLKFNRAVNNVKVLKLTSNGDGLALIDLPLIENRFQIVVIPFALPDEIVNFKVFKTHPFHCESDLLKIVQPLILRDDSLINCKYFGKCSGCQYQQLDYKCQLEFKKNTIENAYKFFAKSLMANDKIPPIDETVGSPSQYR